MSINLIRNAKVFLTRNIDKQYRTYLGNEIDSSSTTRTITSASFSGTTLTISVSPDHGVVAPTSATFSQARWQFTVEGVTPANYNGTWQISGVTDGDTLTATKVSGSLPADGAATVGGTSILKIAKYHDANLTREVYVGSDISFSQTTNVETISPNESGDSPLRGERQFNTSVNPIEFSFTTYIRPRKTTAGLPIVVCDEEFLWNALAGPDTMASLHANWAAGVVTGFAVDANGRVTITGNNLTTTGVSVAPNIGEVVGISGITIDLITDAGFTQGQKSSISKEWNAPAKVVTWTASSVVLDLLTQPTISNTNINSNVGTMNIRLFRSAYVRNTDHSYVHFGESDTVQPQHFGMLLAMDNLTYSFDGCVLDSATVNFTLDNVAAVTWTGKAMRIRQFDAELINEAGSDDKTFNTNFYGVVARAAPTAGYIAGKLSTVLLKKNIGGLAGDQYYLPITSATITISNNIQSVTPNTLYEVNRPVAFFNGNRTITGSFSVYLRSGTTVKNGVTMQQTAALVNELFGGTSGLPLVDPKFYLELQVGGSSATTKVHFDMQAASLQVPAIQSEQIISLNVGFRAQGSKPVYTSNADYDIENKNELYIRYYAA